MPASSADIARVRQIADVTVTDFSDGAIAAIIELFPIKDSAGYTLTEEDWTPTYDLYRAAADVVEIRAAKLVTRYDVTADGATMARSQMQDQMRRLAQRLLSRAKPRYANPVFDDDEEDNSGNA